MSLEGFQRALSEMLMSPAFRNRVAEEEGGALGAYELSPLELRRLTQLAKAPGIKTGTILHRSTRLSMLSNTLPRTCRALGPRGLKELVHAYWSEHPPYSSFYLQEGLRFGEFALARLDAGTFRHELLREVLETELALLVLANAEGVWEAPGAGAEGGASKEARENSPVRDGRKRDRRARAEARAPGDASPPLEPGGKARLPERGAWVPRLHPLCRVVRFGRDPDALLARLDAGEPPTDLPEGEHYLLLLAEGPSRVGMRRLGVEPGRALAACDGRSAAADLCARLPARARTFEELWAAGYLLAEPLPA